MRIETIKWGINISILKGRLMINVSSDVYGVCPQYFFIIGKIRVFRSDFEKQSVFDHHESNYARQS
jgi:hypothetical protein